MSNISSRGAQVVVCSVITVFIAAIAVFLRFFTRRRILHVLGSEDWCILLALFFSFGNTTGMIFQTEYALGHHITTISGPNLVSFLKAFYFTVISYNFSLAFTKIAILLLYMRIFTIPKITRVIYAQLAIVSIYGLWLVLCAIFACTPISLWWDKSQKGTCLPTTKVWWGNAILNIATDFMIFFLPLPVIRTLNLPGRQKMGLYLVFALGFFVCIVSIIRLYLLHVATSSTDSSWDNIGIANWSCIELNTGITCACLTTLKPLISHFFPGLLSSARTGDTTFPPNSRYHNTGRSGGKSGASLGTGMKMGMRSKDGSQVGIVREDGVMTDEVDLESLESEREGKVQDEERGRQTQSRSQTPSDELAGSKNPGRGESWLRIDEENLHSVEISAQTGKVTRVEELDRGFTPEGVRKEGWVQGWPASDGSGKGVIRIETVVEQRVS